MDISEGLEKILARITVGFGQNSKVCQNFRIEHKFNCFPFLFWLFKLQTELTDSVVCLAKGKPT